MTTLEIKNVPPLELQMLNITSSLKGRVDFLRDPALAEKGGFLSYGLYFSSAPRRTEVEGWELGVIQVKALCRKIEIRHKDVGRLSINAAQERRFSPFPKGHCFSKCRPLTVFDFPIGRQRAASWRLGLG